MADSPLEADIREKPGGVIIDLRGEINGLAEQAMKDAYARAIESNPGSVTLSFNEVTYINSTGIALIVGVLVEARKQHRKISAVGLADHYKEIFRITRLADFMSINDEEEAPVP